MGGVARRATNPTGDAHEQPEPPKRDDRAKHGATRTGQTADQQTEPPPPAPHPTQAKWERGENRPDNENDHKRNDPQDHLQKKGQASRSPPTRQKNYAANRTAKADRHAQRRDVTTGAGATPAPATQHETDEAEKRETPNRQRDTEPDRNTPSRHRRKAMRRRRGDPPNTPKRASRSVKVNEAKAELICNLQRKGKTNRQTGTAYQAPHTTRRQKKTLPPRKAPSLYSPAL